MVCKKIKLIFLLLCISLKLKAQQDNFKFFDYNNSIANLDIFFNKTTFNPSYAGDTVKLKAGFKRMNYFIGYEDSHELAGLSIEKNVKRINSGIGFLYNFDKDFFKSHVFKLDYNYRFKFKNKIEVRIAASIGLNHYSLSNKIITYNPDPLLKTINDWTNHPLLSLGTLFNLKNHELGIAYSDILNFDLSTSSLNNQQIFKNYFILNYNYNLNFLQNITITPEIISCINTEYNFWIFTTSASFKNLFYAGVLLRSNNTWGFMFAGKPLNKLKIGYVFTMEGFNNIVSNYKYAFHGINLSLIID